MLGAFRIFRKDLFELLDGARGMLLVFVLPSVLLLLVGQIQTRTPPFRMLVAGEPGDDRVFDRLVLLLGELSTVEVTTRQQTEIDPLTALRDGGFDLALNVEGESPDDWRIYTAETHRGRLAAVRRLVGGLSRALHLATESDNGLEDRLREFVAIGTVRPSRLTSYFPLAADPGTDLMAGTMALILCFLPFVLGSPGWIREKQAHTLEVLLAAPTVGPASLVVGKCLYAVLVTLFEFLLMVVLMQSVYGVQVKTGMPWIVLFLLPALLGSALLGLAVSAMVKSHAQSTIAAAVYFFGMSLLSGFFYPVEQASPIVQTLSTAFPLTFVRPLLKAWLVGAVSVGVSARDLGLLWLQCAVIALVAAAAVRGALRRI